MRRRFIVAGLAFALFAIIAPSFADETIGAALTARGNTDTAQGAIFALNSGFIQSGTLANWSFFNNNSGQIGMVVTPLLMTVSGGDYIIQGVGTPRANAGTGIQSFAFGLTSGSAAVGPGVLFGWKDGTNADPSQQGVIQFDFVGTTSAGTQQFLGSGHSNDLTPGMDLAAGVELGAGVGQQDRDYSVQAAAVSTAAPEPASLGLLGTVLLPIAGLARRRKA